MRLMLKTQVVIIICNFEGDLERNNLLVTLFSYRNLARNMKFDWFFI